MARRLPVYLLLDVSGSMSGEPIEAVEKGVQTLVRALNNDPQAIESTYLSVITFSSDVEQVVPLTELPAFNAPSLDACGGTHLGAALRYVKECADREVQKNTAETKGDWRPLVFLMTDGAPTDDYRSGLSEFRQRKWGMVVACAAGSGANTSVLQDITEAVIQLDSADEASIAAFFKWVSASIVTSSKSVGTNQEVTSLSQLPPPPEELTII